MSETLPCVYIIHDKRRTRGLNRMDEKWPPPMPSMPLDEALKQRFEDSDAHFVTYYVPSDDAEPFPRLNKPVLFDVRKLGADILTNYLVLDYDNAGHAPWTDELWDEFLGRYQRACKSKLPRACILSMYTAFYTTRHGARFIFRLEEPVPVDEAEGRLQSLLAAFMSCGIEFNPAECKDWTRLFRLPRVQRDETMTEDEEFFHILTDFEQTVPLDLVPISETFSTTPVRTRPVHTEQPESPEEADSLLWTVGGQGRVRTDWWKQAKKWLRGRESLACIFEGESLAVTGERNSTVISYAGQVVSMLFNRPGTTPQKCYALLCPAVCQLDGDDGGRHWLDTLWHGVTLAWGREAGQVEVKHKERVQQDVAAMTARETILAGVRGWSTSFKLEFIDDDDALWRWIQQRMMVACGPSYYVMMQSGYYSRIGCKKDHLQAMIRRLRMDELMNFWVYSDKEGDSSRVARSIPALIAEHCTVIETITGRANISGAYLYPTAAGPELVLPLYHLRRDLEPLYSKSVDEWLTVLGGDQHDILKEWIGHSLDFTRAICALSILGRSGCGKKLLIQGLAECVPSEMYADGYELTSNFQQAIMRTPFVNVNEGFPASSNWGRDPADSFRHWVSGDPIMVNRKHVAQVVIRSPIRVIITANNISAVRSLHANKTLTLEDREALGTRLLHIHVSDLATDWFKRKGSYTFTKGWISGDDGAPSKYIVARHFMWLHKTRTPAPPHRRLLVEGSLTQDVVRDMAVESGVAPTVVECLLKMLEQMQLERGMLVDTKNGSVCVTADSVVQFARKLFVASRLNHRNVGNVLRSLKLSGWPEGPILMKEGARKRKARWWGLDLDLLLRQAELNGHPHEKLLEVMK